MPSSVKGSALYNPAKGPSPLETWWRRPPIRMLTDRVWVEFSMTKRSRRQIEIVNGMIEDALISARDFERACEAFADGDMIDEVADVIEELSEWIEERDADRLEEFGIFMEEDAIGQLVFRKAGQEEPFVVRPRADLTIAAGGRIVQLNPDLPILEEDIYAEVVERLFIWAGVSETRPGKRFN